MPVLGLTWAAGAAWCGRRQSAVGLGWGTLCSGRTAAQEAREEAVGPSGKQGSCPFPPEVQGRQSRVGWVKKKEGPRDPQALAAVSSDVVLVGPPGGSQVETWICQSHGGSEGLVGSGGACLPLAGSGSARLEGCATQVGSVLSVQPDPRVPWRLAPACVCSAAGGQGPWRPEGSGMGAPLRIDPGQLLARGLLSDGPLDLLKKQNGKVTACCCSGSSACDELRTTRPHRDPWGYHQAWLPCGVWVLNQLFSCPPFPAGEQVARDQSRPGTQRAPRTDQA